jgi:uncharacterized UPF0160 family protein
MSGSNTPRNIATHSGKFHTDEVFAVATLMLRFGNDMTVVRTREQAKIDEADIVVDVGRVYDPERHRFDHHQLGAPTRENGSPYSSFGMVWNAYGAEVCGSEEVALRIDERIATPIDLTDNGAKLATPLIDHVTPIILNHIVASFRPTWKDKASGDDEFAMAVSFAKDFLARVIKQTQAEVEGERFVVEAYQSSADKRIIELTNRRLPWEVVLAKYREPLYMIAPRFEDTNWAVATVPIVPHELEGRKPLPLAWAGKAGAELEEATGVKGAVFCHKDRYLIVVATKEGAHALALRALEQ